MWPTCPYFINKIIIIMFLNVAYVSILLVSPCLCTLALPQIVWNYQHPFKRPVYCVIIQSALEGGNHADWIPLHLTELIVFPAGQISLRSGILFLSLFFFFGRVCFAFELFSGILAGHSTSTTLWDCTPQWWQTNEKC